MNLINNCIQLKKTTLASGVVSDFYVDLRILHNHPHIMKMLVDLFPVFIKGFVEIDYIVGMPYGAIPFATLYALEVNKPLLIIRKEGNEKNYGNKANDLTGKKIMLIEDTTTTGDSINRVKDKIETLGGTVEHLICIVDRGGVQNVQIENKTVICKIDYNNLVFSNDMTTMDSFFDIIDKLGDKLFLMKTHVDIISDFDAKIFVPRILEYKHKYNFMIIEDQKYGDIGNIVRCKYINSVYEIYKWADYITVHSLVGYGTIEGLIVANPKVKILLVAELSTDDNLITKEYTAKTIELAKKYKNNVIGFISQNRLEDCDDFIHMSPGFHLTQNKDATGQKWNEPTKLKTDFCIVGRDIYTSENPLETFNKYLDILKDTTCEKKNDQTESIKST